MSVASAIEFDKKEGVLATLAANLKACQPYLGDWSVGALTFGLSTLYQQHQAQKIRERVAGEEISDRDFVWDLHRNVTLSFLAYEAKAETIRTKCAEEGVEVLKESMVSEDFCPAYYIAVDNKSEHVLLVIRGTNELKDVVTDLAGAFVELGSGYSHYGILQAAKALLEKEKEFLIKEMNERGYGLKLVGHSLGAGAACLLCYMINTEEDLFKEFGEKNAVCVGIATPPVLTQAEADQCADHVTSLVMASDVVPRASIANLETLREEVAASGWEEELKKLSQNKDLHIGAGLLGGSLLFGAPFFLALGAHVAASLAPEEVKQGMEAKVQQVIADLGVEEKTRLPREKAAEIMKNIRDGASQWFESAKESSLGSFFSQKWGNDDSKGTVVVKEDVAGKPKETVEIEPPKLYAPGSVFHINRNEDEEGQELFSLVKLGTDDRVDRIVLNRHMIADHFCDAYHKGLKFVIDNHAE